MNFTREDHPQLGCGADVAAALDQLAQQAASVQQATSAQPDSSASSETSAPSASSDLLALPEASPPPPAAPPAQKRAPRSFQTPPRPGRGRLASREHAPVRNLGSHTDDTGRILLPIDLRDEIEEQAILEYEAHRAERAALALAKMEADEEKRAKSSRQAAEAKEAKPLEEEAKAPGKQVGSRVARTRRAAEITSLVSPTCFCEQVAALPANRRLAVYSPDALKKLEKGGASADSEAHKRNKELFTQLTPKGALRRVGLARSIEAVLALEQSHPHFSEVIQFVADRIALQKASRRPVGIPPMLLFGPPGVGKTHFCEALASILHVPVRRHPMDQAETSSALLGSEQTWGNTRYGLVFEMLAIGDYANPVVILDELDKACRGQGSGGSMQSPTAVLHSLLEPISASKVRDISVDMELDASLITWIATANYPWLIPPTLRSRMKEFLIRMPTAEQSLLVAASVVTQAIKDSGTTWSEPPDRRFIAAVAHLSAREIYQATATAAAAAMRRAGQRAGGGQGSKAAGIKATGGKARYKLEVTDLPLDVLRADEDSVTPPALLH